MGTVGYPLLLNSFLSVVYVRSDYAALYDYIKQQPNDIRIASLTKESENIPAFTGRSVLLSRGHSIAYHQGYYSQIRERTLDLIAAQYSPDLSALQSVLNKYDIDFWLVDNFSFNLNALPNQWLRQFQTEWSTAIDQLKQQPSALQQLLPVCTVVNDQEQTLVSPACILSQ